MKTCPNPECPDLEEYGRPGEFRDEIDLCPQCGTSLVPYEAPKEGITEADPGDDFLDDTIDAAGIDESLVLGGSVNNATHATIAKSLLEDAGIPFHVRNEQSQDLLGLGRFPSGFNVLMGGIEFWVAPENQAEAVQLFADLESTSLELAEDEDPPESGRET
jgi:hypothetical protein